MTDVPDALVEKAAHALYVAEGGGSSAHWPTEWGELTDGPRHVYLSRARAVLAAVWPDLAEEKRRAIESALILAAAHDESAARPVVDKDTLMQAVTVGCGSADGVRHPSLRIERIADAVLTVVQDAADVRRAVAEEAALAFAEWAQRHPKAALTDMEVADFEATLRAVRGLAREAGGTP